MGQFKPTGYPSLSPYMIVEDAKASLRFVEQVFDGEKLRVYPDKDGRIHHAEIRIGEAVVMLTDGADGWPPAPGHVHLYVEDVDATYRRALDHGAVAIQEPVKKSDPDKRGGFKDPGGITWWVATMVDPA